MTLALITSTAIFQIFPGPTADINVPALWQQENASAGWQSPDGVYSLVNVTPFVAPAGQEIVGAPSYSLNGGVVTETYATQAIPAPSVSALAFRALFTSAERLAITTAGETVPAIREFMDDESAAGTVSLSDPEVIQGIGALVTAGLLTQDRATAILAGTPPSTS